VTQFPLRARRANLFAAALAASAVGFAASAGAAELTPTGQALTPAAAKGALFQPLDPDLPDASGYTAGQASAVALSPDGRTLLILTSGFNRMFGADGKFIATQSNEYIFVYDVSGDQPVKRQVLTVPDSFIGIAWAPDGGRFYVAGGDDDDVLEFAKGQDRFAQARRFPLGHGQGLGLAVKPEAAGLAVSPDGRRLLVANLQNDSVSLIALASGRVREIELRPGAISPARTGQPGGSFPRSVAFVSNTRAYVASERDREIIALDLAAPHARVAGRIKTAGQPVALLAGRAGRLYAALDNTDAVAVIDTRTGRVLETIPTAAPKGLLGPDQRLGGAGSNSLALSPDGRSLLVTNGGENALAVVALDATASGLKPRKLDDDGDGDDDDQAEAVSAVAGLIPTGWYPTGVAVRPDGRRIYIVNGKSNAGPNPGACRDNLKIGPDADADCRGANQYVWQLEKAGFLALPAPSAAELGRLTQLVAENDHFPGASTGTGGDATMAFLRAHIRHVIYIVKENRTYDQVLGDLEVGNGDPRLAVFGRAMTPNQHALARRFVDLDDFFDSGESSNTGWNWTTAARTNDFTEREAPVNYADRGLQYDQEGDNRNLNMGFSTEAQRAAVQPLAPKDPDILPGARDVAAPDGPGGAEGHGYIWDGALKAGLTVRNWGFYGDLSLYAKTAGPARTPRLRDPHAAGVTVFTPTKAALMPLTDPYFRGFDQGFPDYWRFKEWEREFDGFVAKGQAPNLMLVRLPHDHTGEFAEGVDGINSVETELADNDYAVGLLVQKVAESPFAKDTLIVVVEDDAQDGPDHVDAHRSTAYFAGPYVKQGAVVSTRYTTVDMVRTIEDVLGIAPLGLNDALARPMGEVFDTTKADWSFKAQVPAALRATTLPLPPVEAAEARCPAAPARSSAYWSAAMAGQDFSREDHLDTAAFNRALWRGLRGEAPYPAARDGRDLRQDRAALLAADHVDLSCD
jgi:DNA-binding beta-propeller fold protein YncE